jgi:hypothetical protein
MTLRDKDFNEDVTVSPFTESTEVIIYADARRQENSNSHGPVPILDSADAVYGSTIGSQ